MVLGNLQLFKVLLRENFCTCFSMFIFSESFVSTLHFKFVSEASSTKRIFRVR